MTITHELIILPEAKPRMGTSTPDSLGKRAVLLVSKRSVDPSGTWSLEQKVFDAGDVALWLETKVDHSEVDIIANRTFVIGREYLKSRGLGTLVLRRAFEFAHGVSSSKSALVLSLSLSAVDEVDPENKARRNSLYSGIGYRLDNLPASRQFQQPLSDFRTGIGDPPGVQITTVAVPELYERYLAHETSRLNREHSASVPLSTGSKGAAVVEDASTPWYGKTSAAAAVAAILFAIVLLGLLLLSR
jgi:hypothetical protein